jgi:hypothetical protein
MFLFHVPPDPSTGALQETILHTGDFRWQPWMLEYPGLKGVKVDTLYLVGERGGQWVSKHRRGGRGDGGSGGKRGGRGGAGEDREEK